MNKIFLKRSEISTKNTLDKYEQDISKKGVKSSQKHPGCKNFCSQELKNGHAGKDVKSKMGGQEQRSDSADENKILIITIQATKCY